MVSIIIPVKNSAFYLKNCLESIRRQSYKEFEVILIDSNSTDETKTLAREYYCQLFQYQPKINKGAFEAPHKRNFGASKAKGQFIYYLDADMELEKNVLKESVALCQEGYDAVIISEDSFGKGIWAQAKNLERRCYWGDDTIEAPRFVKTGVWNKIGGVDTSVGGGGDDWDLYQKLLDHGYRVGRIKSLVRHNEGNLRLTKLIKKRFMYGTQTMRYISKRPKAGVRSYFPIRKAYIRHWKLFLQRPRDAVAFVIMRSAEYTAGFAGIVAGGLQRE